MEIGYLHTPALWEGLDTSVRMILSGFKNWLVLPASLMPRSHPMDTLALSLSLTLAGCGIIQFPLLSEGSRLYGQWRLRMVSIGVGPAEGDVLHVSVYQNRGREDMLSS